jgi:hypothetical protein
LPSSLTPAFNTFINKFLLDQIGDTNVFQTNNQFKSHSVFNGKRMVQQRLCSQSDCASKYILNSPKLGCKTCELPYVEGFCIICKYLYMAIKIHFFKVYSCKNMIIMLSPRGLYNMVMGHLQTAVFRMVQYGCGALLAKSLVEKCVRSERDSDL